MTQRDGTNTTYNGPERRRWWISRHEAVVAQGDAATLDWHRGGGCPICRELTDHDRGQSDNDCWYCSSSFVTREGREIHENLEHGIVERLPDPDFCDRCGCSKRKQCGRDGCEHESEQTEGDQFRWVASCSAARTSDDLTAKNVKFDTQGRKVPNITAAEDFHAQVHYWKDRHDKLRDLLLAVADSRCYLGFKSMTEADLPPAHTGDINTCAKTMCVEVRKTTAEAYFSDRDTSRDAELTPGVRNLPSPCNCDQCASDRAAVARVLTTQNPDLAKGDE